MPALGRLGSDVSVLAVQKVVETLREVLTAGGRGIGFVFGCTSRSLVAATGGRLIPSANGMRVSLRVPVRGFEGLDLDEKSERI